MTKPTFPDFSDIQQRDIGDVLMFDDDSFPVINSRPVSRGIGSIVTAIQNGWSQADIERRLAEVNLTLRYEHYDECKDTHIKNEAIEKQREVIAQANSELEEGQEPVELPQFEDYPIAPTPYTYDVLSTLPQTADALRQSDKMKAFEFKGVQCSVAEADQNGWGSITTLLKESVDAGVPFEPVNFKCENGNTVTLDTMAEWLEFILAGAAKRAEFFG